jgi:hypothetical protein
MAAARPPTPPTATTPALLELGRLLLAAAKAHPPPWPERDPTEDLDEPAIVRKARRKRRGGHR